MIDPDPWPEPISDEAARAHGRVPATHRLRLRRPLHGQIRRHMESMRPPPCPAETCHQRQLHLFGEPHPF